MYVNGDFEPYENGTIKEQYPVAGSDGVIAHQWQELIKDKYTLEREKRDLQREVDRLKKAQEIQDVCMKAVYEERDDLQKRLKLTADMLAVASDALIRYQRCTEHLS